MLRTKRPLYAGVLLFQTREPVRRLSVGLLAPTLRPILARWSQALRVHSQAGDIPLWN